MKQLGDGRWLELMPLTFGRARIIVMPHKDSMTVMDGW